MLLAFSLNDSFASSTKNPLLQAIEFNDRGLMCRLQLFMGSSRFIEHTFQLGGLLESCQQQLVALFKIIG
jgi:hypothetical protein